MTHAVTFKYTYPTLKTVFVGTLDECQIVANHLNPIGSRQIEIVEHKG